MNNREKEMVSALEDLKKNYGVIGIKAEFEAEGTRFEECVRLKQIVDAASLPLTVKIGGCEAIRDMHDIKIIGVNRLVAPMIESPFALKKFTESYTKVFSDDEREEIFFAINLETKYTYNLFQEILDCEEFGFLNGVVIGRNDLSYSLGLTREGINETETMKIASDFIIRTKERYPHIVCGIGGGVSALSLEKFNMFIGDNLDYFETRKVIFDYKQRLNVDFEAGILKALNFELLWLREKRDFYASISREDEKRLNTLETRYSHKINQLNIGSSN